MTTVQIDRVVRQRQGAGAKVYDAVASLSAFSSLTFVCLFPGATAGLEHPVLVTPLACIALVSLFICLVSSVGETGKLTVRAAVERPLARTLMIALVIVLVAHARGLFIDIEIAASRTLSSAILLCIQLFFVGSFCVAVSMFRRGVEHHTLARVLFWSAAFMLLIQVSMLALGINHKDMALFLQTNSYSSTLGSFGIQSYRWQLPLATGTNGGVLFPLFAFFAGVFYAKHVGRIIGYGLAAIAIFTLAGIDSRTAVAAAPTALLLVWVCRWSPKKLRLVSLILPTLSVAVVLLVEYMPAEIIDATSARYATYGMFSGREVIWRSFFHDVGHFSPSAFLFGHGMYGQVTSGVVGSYSYIFQNFDANSQALVTLHNAYLQIFIDYGVLGLVVFLYAIAKITEILAAKSKDHASSSTLWRILLCFFLSILISAQTEAMFTPYVREGYSFIVVIALISVLLGKKRRVTPLPA